MSNAKRKEVLLKIDGKENIKNSNLLELGLTTYMKKNNLSDNFTELISYVNNYKRPILHLKNIKEIYWMPEQIRILNMLDKHKKILFAARTSFGKTLIAKEYIFKNNISNIAFITPTNALSKELIDSFNKNENFKNKYSIFDSLKDSEEKIETENNIFVGTQEKFIEIFDKFEKIDLLVIDEAYKLEDRPSMNSRSYILSKTFISQYSEKVNQIILLTPVAEFLGFQEFGFEIISTEFNPVDKIIEDNLNKRKYNDLVIKSIQSSEFSIYYCNSPQQLSDFYKKYRSELIEKTNRIEDESGILNSFQKLVEKEVHPEWVVSKLLSLGILSNHGQMPKFIQRKMLKIFKSDENNFNFLIGTNSISEGINTPTKNLFIDTSIRTTESYLMRLNNTIGRAGRLNVNPIGYIYSELDIKNKLDNIKIKLALSESEELDEILDQKNSEKVLQFSNLEKINSKELLRLLKKYNWSFNKFLRFYLELQNFTYDKFETGVYPKVPKGKVIEICRKINNEKNAGWNKGVAKEKYSLTVNLSTAYKNDVDPNFIAINSYQDKIDAFKFYYSKYTDFEILENSEIIDSIIKMRYATLEYKIMPIINFFFDMKLNDFPSFSPTESVINLFGNIRSDYSKSILKRTDFENLTEDQKKLIKRLVDEGITTSEEKLLTEMIVELENDLPPKYSIVSIENSIKKFAKSSKNKHLYIDILKMYF